MSTNSWTAVFTNGRGDEFRFRLFEDERGKLFLELSAEETVPYAIGLIHERFGKLVHFKTENISGHEQALLKITEDKL